MKILLLLLLPLIGHSQIPVRAPFVPWQPQIGDIVFTPPTSVSIVSRSWRDNPNECSIFKQLRGKNKDKIIVGPMVFKAIKCEGQDYDFKWECLNCEADYGFPVELTGKFAKTYKKA